MKLIAPALGKYLSKHRPVLARESVEIRRTMDILHRWSADDLSRRGRGG